VTISVAAIAKTSGVSTDYVLDLIRLDVIDLPDQGRDYSPPLAEQVVTKLKTRRQRLRADFNAR
jgi:hypothetical protein